MELFDLAEAESPLVTGSNTASSAGSAEPDVAALLAPLTTQLDGLARPVALRVLQRARGHLDAVESRLLADAVDSGSSRQDLDQLSKQAGRSNAAARKATRRADAVSKNPTLADKMSSGELTGEKVDAIADAAAKTDGDAAQDQELLDQVEKAPVDQVPQIVKDWLNQRTTEDETQSEHDRQRRNRKLERYNNNEGLDTIRACGDTATIDEIWNLINADADQLYRDEGGRDVPGYKHPTSHRQRLFDAFASRITGANTGHRIQVPGGGVHHHHHRPPTPATSPTPTPQVGRP